MKKKTHKLDYLPSLGPYSHIVEAGEFLFLSGMLPMDKEGAVIIDDISKATQLTLDNIKKALTSVGSNMEKVVKVSVFLAEMSDFDKMNSVYKGFFPSSPPARTCISVKSLPRGAQIEIEVTAIK